MWVYLTDAFLSIVRPHRGDGSMLLVRARFAGDIERALGVRAQETPARDYRYRANVPTERVSERLARAVRAIDYSNYKATLRDPLRHRAAARAWEAMFDAQQEAAANEPRRRRRS